MKWLLPDGKESPRAHENFQFIKIDGRWRLISSDYMPHHAWIYTMRGTGDKPEDWLVWENGTNLGTPKEDWNTFDVDNGGAISDWREYDGHFYLIYGGSGELRKGEFVGPGSHRPWPRGWNRLGLARSKDLVHWEIPKGAQGKE